MPKELCEGFYLARRDDSIVTVFAVGIHPTGGVHSFLDPLKSPNMFALYHLAPQGGVVAQAITPFKVHLQYTAGKDVTSVIVYDRKGRHDIRVADDHTRAGPSGDGADVPSQLIVESSATSSWFAPKSPLTVIGKSSNCSVDEAIRDALRKVSEQHIPTNFVRYQVDAIHGEEGGYGGIHELAVEVTVSW